MQEAGPLGVDSRRGAPLSHAQACVLIGSEETPELEIVDEAHGRRSVVDDYPGRWLRRLRC
jgi:hypothetical protein